jgi:hypothetical protein
MRQFLKETGELYYSAMFRPSLWEAFADEEPLERLYLHFSNRRFSFQLALLVLLLSLPLVAAVSTSGQPLAWLFVATALISSYGTAVWFLPLGLHLPLLFALIYIVQPAVLWHSLQEAISLLPPWPQLAIGIGVYTIGMVITALTGYWLWQRKQVPAGRVVLFVGSTLSVAGGGWLASQVWWLSLVMGSIVALFLFPVLRDYKAGEVAVAVAVAVAVGVGVGGLVGFWFGFWVAVTVVGAVGVGGLVLLGVGF